MTNQTRAAVPPTSMKASTLPDPRGPHKLNTEGRQTVAQGGEPTTQKVTVSTAFLSTSTSRFSHSHSIFSLTLPFAILTFIPFSFLTFLTFSLFLPFFFFDHSFITTPFFSAFSSLKTPPYVIEANSYWRYNTCQKTFTLRKQNDLYRRQNRTSTLMLMCGMH